MKAHFILFVADRRRSSKFYSSVLQTQPSLDVPGMTEFPIGDAAVLGLMPEDGIARLLGTLIAHPSTARGTSRSELYLVVQNAADFQSRAMAAGARELSPLALRDWGHNVAYSLDPDGHILAFASLPDTLS
jgi:predicted enzyme related to lactoylglutathione lyase